MNSAPDERGSALLTDLYQLTMLQAYFDRDMDGIASFEFFSRRLPQDRNFLMAAGLEQTIHWLQNLRFTPEELDWLESTGRFRSGFLKSLENLRFTGDVWAMPEGTLAFADEPILRITAPLREAQLIESRLLNLMHFQTVVASKAARCVLSAHGRQLVDFGLRRAHGAEAALLSARASYIAGFSGTANALAGLRFDIPVFGTMAHSYIQAHGHEAAAFEHFARSQPNRTTLLIDTYDTEAAAHKVVTLARILAPEGIEIGAVRLDSGDLGALAHRVRSVLDAGGLCDVGIVVSGNLDEWRMAELVRAAAPVDGFGVGTRMNTSADAPFLDCAYKLVDYEGLARRKRSLGKATWPGVKQVWRMLDDDGHAAHDLIALESEGEHDGMPLLRAVMTGGRRIDGPLSLAAIRAHGQDQLATLPERWRALSPANPFPVRVSTALQALAHALDAEPC
jgi:nicotinate phosphoribosyltransferase